MPSGCLLAPPCLPALPPGPRCFGHIETRVLLASAQVRGSGQQRSAQEGRSRLVGRLCQSWVKKSRGAAQVGGQAGSGWLASMHERRARGRQGPHSSSAAVGAAAAAAARSACCAASFAARLAGSQGGSACAHQREGGRPGVSRVDTSTRHGTPSVHGSAACHAQHALSPHTAPAHTHAQHTPAAAPSTGRPGSARRWRRRAAACPAGPAARGAPPSCSHPATRPGGPAGQNGMERIAGERMGLLAGRALPAEQARRTRAHPHAHVCVSPRAGRGR